MGRVLLTGADGYLGVRMADWLLRGGFDVVGLDTGFHRDGWLYDGIERRPPMIAKDVRHLERGDLEGFDAVVHLAEISNDPVGELAPDVTYAINHRGTVRLARLARSAGVRRFVHMSSCSVYGEAAGAPSTEVGLTAPLTAYARCKLLVEHDVGALADERFSPIFLRNATVFGACPRQRFDLVVNDLVAAACLYREIRMTSDGTPWRPFVHLLDVARAVSCVLEAPRDLVHGEIFNVGADHLNHQIKDVAAIVGELVPGCDVVLGERGVDRRDYSADFGKIHERLPGFRCAWDIERGAAELLDVLGAIGFNEAMYRSRGYTRLDQIRHLLATGQVDRHLHWTA